MFFAMLLRNFAQDFAQKINALGLCFLVLVFLPLGADSANGSDLASGYSIHSHQKLYCEASDKDSQVASFDVSPVIAFTLHAEDSVTRKRDLSVHLRLSSIRRTSGAKEESDANPRFPAECDVSGDAIVCLRYDFELQLRGEGEMTLLYEGRIFNCSVTSD